TTSTAHTCRRRPHTASGISATRGALPVSPSDPWPWPTDIRGGACSTCAYSPLPAPRKIHAKRYRSETTHSTWRRGWSRDAAWPTCGKFDTASPHTPHSRKWPTSGSVCTKQLCPGQTERAIERDDRRSADDLATIDHPDRLIEWEPTHVFGLIDVRAGVGEIRAAGEIHLLRMVQSADRGLVGDKMLHRARPPPSFLFDLPGSGCRDVLSVVDISARQLPHPPVDDESVPVHQQRLSALVEHQSHRAG